MKMITNIIKLFVKNTKKFLQNLGILVENDRTSEFW